MLLWRKYGRRLLAGLVAALVPLAAFVIIDEIRTSRREAALFTSLARKLEYRVEPGASSAIRFPRAGPYDERLGYHELPAFVTALESKGYAVTAQARMSPRLLALADAGFFPTYREKNQAGLELRDCRAEPLFGARFPQRAYRRFEDVPPVLVDALLFIENQDLLDARQGTRNPAVDWDRLGRAVLDQMLHVVDNAHPTAGGSTLATQIEKYRHSPAGRTESVGEKLRQMISATLRAYRDGEDTLARRKQIVLDYLNTVPLSAQAGFGEVSGVADGLWAWYGRDFAEFNRSLSVAVGGLPQSADRLQQRQALAFKQALSLIVAERRPSYYLGGGEANLAALTNGYLRLLADAGVIDTALRDAALPIELKVLAQAPQEQPISFIERKAATALRGRLASLLDMPRAYDLARLDLAADTTLDGETQRAATQLLRSLRSPAGAKAAGLYGFRLLQEGDDPSKLMFSFTLFERGEGANRLRVQTDSFDQPFDINDGARLDLGSTAKLRTLITYLEIVAELHGRWSALNAKELAAVAVYDKDALGRWARDYLLRAEDRSLATMLEAAMRRSYSASPAEAFFTGGGLHRFENFDPAENGRAFIVREAFRRSVNLAFVRLMRDIVNHVIFTAPGSSVRLLERSDASRQEVLARFADREGRQFITRFYRKYRGLPPPQAEDLLLNGTRVTPARLASVFASLEPEAEVDRLTAFLKQRLPGTALSEGAVRALHEQYGAAPLSLADRGYVAGVHPLELWVAGFLRHHPGASLADTVAASKNARQDAYRWLFTSRRKNAQDVRIRAQLELEAFLEIQRAWKKLGYPFESLTPSYATAIGASGDRPAALAELMGIIANRGMRLPVARIERLEFARDTPYETRLAHQSLPAERVLAAEIADIVRRSLVDVVEEGTARRLRRALALSDGTVIEIGGKTGTGDHRFEVYGRGGQLISSRVVNRSATFAFLIGDRYFGTMMVYVPEPDAAKYNFTSALPAQLLKSMAPVLRPLLERGTCAPPVSAAASPIPRGRRNSGDLMKYPGVLDVTPRGHATRVRGR